MAKTEKLTATETAAWFAFWLKHKNKIYGFALLIIGALGGNVDNIVSALPDVHDVKGLRTKVEVIETDVQNIKDNCCNSVDPAVKPESVPTPDVDIKVERK